MTSELLTTSKERRHRFSQCELLYHVQDSIHNVIALSGHPTGAVALLSTRPRERCRLSATRATDLNQERSNVARHHLIYNHSCGLSAVTWRCFVLRWRSLPGHLMSQIEKPDGIYQFCRYIMLIDYKNRLDSQAEPGEPSTSLVTT